MVFGLFTGKCIMAKKGKKKKRKKKNYFLNTLLTFLLVFSSVLILGVLLFLVWQNTGKKETGKMAGEDPARDNSAILTENIPQEEPKDLPETGEAQGQGGLLASAPEEGEGEEEPVGKYGEILADPAYMAENNIYAKETVNEGEVTLAFGGDILFDPAYSVMASLLQRSNGIYDSISEDLMDEMKDADIMMINNEFPYSSRGIPTEGKQFTFRARPESASILEEMGVDIVSLANNHAYDYGEDAFLDTLDTLAGIGMPYVGAGRNLEEASKPVYFIAGDIKIAIVSATQIERLDNPDTKGATDDSAGVFRCLNPDRLLDAVREAKENSDFVVVYIHWGTENTVEVDWAQLDQAPKIADAGADLIIGDHPHCLQPIEYVNGVPVVYSLGNFWFNSKELDTCIVKAVVGEDGLRSLQFIPALQKGCKTSMLHGEEKARVLNYMRSISPKIDIDEAGFISAR